MSRACASSDWPGVARLLDRAMAEHSGEIAELVELARNALASRPEQHWWLDEAEPAFEAIFPLLAPDERWGVVRRAILGSASRPPSYRASLLADTLDDLCRLAARSVGEHALRTGLQRLLAMHELWLTGDGKVPPPPRMELTLAATGGSGWPEVFLNILFQLLEFDDEDYLQAALRGMSRLLRLQVSLYPRLVALAEASEPALQRRLLLMAESIAVRTEAAEFRRWLRQATASPRLDIALSAWAALRTGCRAIGEPEPGWPQPIAETPRVIGAARSLVVRLPNRRGLLTSTGRASLAVLDHLEEALGRDVDDLRSAFAASVRDDALAVRPRRPRRVGESQLLFDPASEAEMDRLFLLLRQSERQGRFAGTPIKRIAQAITAFADPFVFLNTPIPGRSLNTWPIDDRLDSLCASGRHGLEAGLGAILEADLGEATRLVAGDIQTHSHKKDVRVSVDHSILAAGTLQRDERPSILNGRASLAYENPDETVARLGSASQLWLTQTVGGLIALAGSVLNFFPGRVWQERLLWEPSAEDPLVWIREGRRVAWFERIRGPVRNIYPGDFSFRQPVMSRWVCDAGEWDRAVSLLGLPRRRVRIEVESVHEG